MPEETTKPRFPAFFTVLVALALTPLTACSGAPRGGTMQRSSPPGASGRRMIRLHRPFAAGARVVFEASATERTQSTVTLDGAPGRSEQREEHAQLAAHASIVSVDGHGQPLVTRFTVDRMLYEDVGQPDRAVSLAAHQVLEVGRTGPASDAVITIDGQPASQGMRHAIEMLVRLGSGESDDVFGTREPRGPGESWAADSDRAAQWFAASSGVRGRYTGGARFLGLTTARGVPCMSIEMSLDGDIESVPGLPAGVVIDRARFTSNARVMLPTDERAPAVQATTETRVAIDAHVNQQGHAAVLHQENTQSRSVVTLLE